MSLDGNSFQIVLFSKHFFLLSRHLDFEGVEIVYEGPGERGGEEGKERGIEL